MPIVSGPVDEIPRRHTTGFSVIAALQEGMREIGFVKRYKAAGADGLSTSLFKDDGQRDMGQYRSQ